MRQSWPRSGYTAVVFDFSGGKLPVANDLASLFTRTFEDIASPGNRWNGIERVTIAQTARGTLVNDDIDVLPEAALEATARIARAQVTMDESRVRDTVSAIGETRYVELVGITSIMNAVDSITELLGFDLEPLPEPRPGDLVPTADNPRLKRRSAWVPMNGPPKPRFAISAAPGTQATVNRLLDRLFPSVNEVGNDEPVRGLTREQMEIVALKVSHSNQCFW